MKITMPICNPTEPSRSRFRIKRFLLCLGLVVWLVMVSGRAFSAGSLVDLEVPDLELVNQDGEKGRLLSDFIGDRLAAITFTYTNCTTICPVLDGIFLSVQKKIAEDLGKDIVLITISIDPDTDIPQRLKAHAEKLGTKPGWIFLTGEKADITKILRGFEVFSTDILSHPPSVFVLDGQKKEWHRLYGFPSGKSIVSLIQELQDER